MDRPEHTYHPRLWYPLVVAVMCAVAALAVRGLFDTSFLALLVMPVLIPIIVWRQLRLTLSAAEVSVAGRSLPWDRVVIISTRWGESLGSEPGTPLRERVRVYLPLYERSWRTRSIGADVRRWAPHLLPPAEDGVS